MSADQTVQANASFTFTVSEEWDSKRLDAFITVQFPRYSRSYLQKLIRDGRVLVNEQPVTKSGVKLVSGDTVSVTFPPAISPDEVKEIVGDLGAKIRFEHPDFFIVYKPIGLSMHKAHEHDETITLVDWMLAQFANLKEVGHVDRPGIVHRLDKYTSGLVIIPRTNYAHGIFGNLFHDRQIDKTYYAIVRGHPPREGTIDLPIQPHSSHTRMMASRKAGGKPAVTHYKVLEYFDDAALVEVNLETGRTHQIRVHFAATGHPLLGDIVYGRSSDLIDRQALHAGKLAFEYEGTPYEFEETLPEDMVHALEKLRLSSQ